MPALQASSSFGFVEEVEKLVGAGLSLTKAQQKAREGICCSESTGKRYWREREQIRAWARTEQRRATKRAGSCRKQGQRVPLASLKTKNTDRRKVVAGHRRYLGRWQPLRPVLDALDDWKQFEEQLGHTLRPQSLLRQFRVFLRSAILTAEDTKQAGTCSPEDEKYLTAWKDTEGRLRVSQQKRSNMSAYVAAQLDLVLRAKQRQTSLTVRQEQESMETGWAIFDRVLHTAAFESAKKLRDYVAEPERWMEQRDSIVISMSDQILVWLLPSDRKVLVNKKKLQTAQKKITLRKRRAEAAQSKQEAEADFQDETLTKTPGNAAHSKTRITLVARQLVKGYFAEEEEPTGQQCY